MADVGGRAVERRIVSVLFADLVGFTSLSEQLDPEDVAAVQAAYFDTVRATIERYGGRLEKFIGDAAMAVFGVPRTRDDDAERAVRAALALAAAVEQLAARVGLESGALAVRVGVNSGEVVHTPDAGPEEAMVTGDAVNVAARLQSAAERGTVLVGETTALAVAAAIDLGEPMALELKGKSEPVGARRAVAVRPEPSRDAAMGSLRAPLLGREKELASLRGELERSRLQALRVLVVAPPGVGKTRLVDELAAGAADVAVLRARLRPDVLAPFDPVAQLLSSAGPSASLEEKLRDTGVTSARARVVVEEVAALLQPGAESTDRESRFSAWLEALDALAADRRALWIVEDVHWAGADLLAFLSYAGEAPGRRLVVATSRPSLLDAAPEWCAAATQLDLHTLPVATASELVGALVGDAVPEELAARIAEASDGNPLFIEELLRTWISVGTLLPRDGGWALAAEPGDVPLPQTVHAIYAAQLDDLPASAREVARRASVAGRRFAVAALDPLEVAAPQEGVELLARRALVTGPTSDELFGKSFAYRHALLRDAGYASLARAERARLHARLAAWLETAAGEGSVQVLEPIARHYARALESMPTLARDIVGLKREDCRMLAAHFFERAAAAARDLAAHESARELLHHSLDHTDDDVARAVRLTLLGEITASVADMDEGARMLEEALGLARSVGDRSAIAAAAAAVSFVLDLQVQFIPAARVADAALAEIGERDDLETALLLVRRATAVTNASDAVDEPRADAERALVIARARDDRKLELEALDLVLSFGGASIDAWQQLEELALDAGDWKAAVGAMHSQALRLAPDHADEAAAVARRGIELAEARGLRESLAWLHQADVEIGLVSGAWDEAIAAAHAALEIGVANGYDRAVIRTWSAVLPIAAARGDEELLDAGAAWLRGRFREPENPSPYARVMMAARQLELARRGLREPFVPDVEERLASFELRYSSPSWLAALESVVDVWLAAGELEGAGLALDRLDASAESPEMAVLGRSTARLLRAKWLAAGGADPSEPAREALDGFRSSGAPWWIAKALRALGEPKQAAELERKLGITWPNGG